MDLIKYPRTPHVAGLRQKAGDEDLPVVPLHTLNGTHLVIEEKVDGANSVISFDADDKLYLQSQIRRGWRPPKKEILALISRERRAEAAAADQKGRGGAGSLPGLPWPPLLPQIIAEIRLASAELGKGLRALVNIRVALPGVRAGYVLSEAIMNNLQVFVAVAVVTASAAWCRGAAICDLFSTGVGADEKTLLSTGSPDDPL